MAIKKWQPTAEEPYYTFSRYCQDHYGRRLYRIALDAGMTCPNRDGTIGVGGCIFCDEGGSGDFAISYHGQRLKREDFFWFHKKDVPDGDFIAYFQAYTNTYAPLSHLRTLYTAALRDPLFAGLSIATRPDCMGEDVMELLSELKANFPDKFIWVEIGLQTIHEDSARLINRGYPLSVFEKCAKELRERRIPFLTHVILGLPNETPEMMYETISYLDRVHTAGVKLQLLHVLRDTALARMYEAGGFETLSMEKYVEIVVGCIGRLSPDIVVHRLTGDGSAKLLLSPLWSCQKRRVLNEIRHSLKVSHITQGCLCEEPRRDDGRAIIEKAPVGAGEGLLQP